VRATLLPGEVNGTAGEWHAKLLPPAEEGRWMRIEWAKGQIVGISRFHDFRLMRIPYWMVWGVLGLWPAWWGISRAGRGVRWWSRWRGGRCLACGYDLRGSVGRRCSECGELVGTLAVGANGPGWHG
jgi:hypothetical protein